MSHACAFMTAISSYIYYLERRRRIVHGPLPTSVGTNKEWQNSWTWLQICGSADVVKSNSCEYSSSTCQALVSKPGTVPGSSLVITQLISQQSHKAFPFSEQKVKDREAYWLVWDHSAKRQGDPILNSMLTPLHELLTTVCFHVWFQAWFLTFHSFEVLVW